MNIAKEPPDAGGAEGQSGGAASRAAYKRAKKELLAFDWHNYGLDEVEEADKSWAHDLALRVAARLAKP